MSVGRPSAEKTGRWTSGHRDGGQATKVFGPGGRSEALKKSGVKIVNANPAFVAEVQKRSAPIVDDWVKKATAKGVDGAKILAEFREELKKVAAGK